MSDKALVKGGLSGHANDYPRFVEKSNILHSTIGVTAKPLNPYNSFMGRPRKAKAAAVRDPLAVKIGGRIADARKHRKWRLKDLETHSGLSISRLGNYETGERMPSPAEALLIASALGESASYLLCLVDDTDPVSVRNSEEAALLELYRTVDPPERRRALDRLAALALLKREAIQDDLSAKGKAHSQTGAAARARSSSRRTDKANS